MYGIILAGGSGSRLWPLSRELYPKQLLNLNSSDKSLLQSTFEELNSYIPQDKIVTMTNTRHSTTVKLQLQKFTAKPIILSEPISKNTAPAVALGTKFITQKFGKDEIILVVPSDLLINKKEEFICALKKAERLANQGYLVTFGIKPKYTETGYGYIHISNELNDGFKVDKFVEKPDTETAQNYIQDGSYYWNSGIFMFKASIFLDELKLLASKIFEITEKFNFNSMTEIPYVEFEKMPNISIDYSVMEKSDKVAFVPLECDWNDFGSWQSIYNLSQKDKNGNVISGHVVDKGAKDSFIFSSSKLVTTIGLEDMVIVETEDAILACKKNRAQEVKKIYETLKEKHDDTQMVHKKVYRPWGYYKVIAQGEGFLSKIIHVNSGQKLSVQSHNFRSEHWVILSGKANVILGQTLHKLEPGNSVDIAVKEIHSLKHPYDKDWEIIEIQKGDILSEDDII